MNYSNTQEKDLKKVPSLKLEYFNRNSGAVINIMTYICESRIL